MEEIGSKKEGWLFILPWPAEAVGGVNRVVLELCRVMNSDGKFCPYILVLDWKAETPVVNVKENYIEIRYRMYTPSSNAKDFLRFLSKLPTTLKTLSSMMREKNIKVVNPHYPGLSSLNFVFLRLLPQPFSFFISFHGTDLKEVGKASVANRLFWKLLSKSVDKIVACSEGLLGKVNDLFPLAKNKSLYIHNGVSPDFIDNVSYQGAASLVGASKGVILSVGTFEYNKGQDVLIRALPAVLENFPEYKLVLLGRTTDYLKSLRALIEELKIIK